MNIIVTQLAIVEAIKRHVSLILNKEKHKLVHTIYRSLDREWNPRPLAYGNTASIEGTTTLTTTPNPLLQK
jgi:hypothetical protein